MDLVSWLEQLVFGVTSIGPKLLSPSTKVIPFSESWVGLHAEHQELT